MINKVFKFKDDEFDSIINIAINHIVSYGVCFNEINTNTGLPTCGEIWINTTNGSFNRLLPYEMAIEMEEDITKAINLA